MEETKAKFFDRAIAYFIDFFIIYFLFSLITMIFPLSNHYNALIEQKEELSYRLLEDETPNYERYMKELSNINYDLNKELVVLNGINYVLIFIYFGVCAYMCEGRTLGKYLMKIRVKSQDGTLKWWQMLLRPFLINSLFSGVMNIILLYILNPVSYTMVSQIILYLDMIFVIICGFMILYSKKQLGLHDRILKTEVIKEVKKNG